MDRQVNQLDRQYQRKGWWSPSSSLALLGRADLLVAAVDDLMDQVNSVITRLVEGEVRHRAVVLQDAWRIGNGGVPRRSFLVM